ncbi:MAG TPA: fluoride efflux transporter CrcB [Acidimicrobiia bacterium]|nr:fluoride efflux transporter CrcB [Acidimicrobiia bacterium]
MSPSAWVAFVVAGAGGAVARYLLDRAVADRAQGVFPWGTLVINLTGSLLLGVITGLALHHGLPKAGKIVLGTGFCGAYTTFSTFSFETVRLLEEGALNEAFRNAAGTLVACAAAATLGLAVTSL